MARARHLIAFSALLGDNGVAKALQPVEDAARTQHVKWCGIEYKVILLGHKSDSIAGVSAWESGDFLYHITTPDEQLSNATRPGYFISLQDGILEVAQPGAGQYFTTRDAKDYGKVPPPPGQWHLCPWPLVTRMIDWIKDANDHKVVNIDGSTWELSSKSAGLAIHLDDYGELKSLIRGAPNQSVHEVATYKYAGSGMNRAPTDVIVHGVYGSGGIAKVVDLHYRVTSWKSASRGDPEPPRFDPARWNLLRLNENTGDITTLDGTFLYNRIERERELMEQMSPASVSGYSYWIWGGVVVAALGVAWWRWSRHRAGE
ncbi:MAG: hypothetical protein IT435_14860 [Phycisphaerales bacterium]|nr:hypothetical protein [Phycisphaerales bacterium]